MSGLSKKFIYFNDDVFLGSPVLPEDFVMTSGVQKVGRDQRGREGCCGMMTQAGLDASLPWRVCGRCTCRGTCPSVRRAVQTPGSGTGTATRYHHRH